MRLIDADALKKKAQECATEAWKMNLTTRIETVINQFIDWIDDAPTIEDEWTPCSERLPDTDIPVLVSDGVYVWEDELQEDYEDGKTMYWWDSQCSFDFNDTAWMPKPKPYKGGKKR